VTAIGDEPRSAARHWSMSASRIALGAAALLYVAFRLSNLGAFSLWGDEVFSLRAARMPLGTMFEAVVADGVHPPLFYLLLKSWVAIGGEAVWWLRLLPAVTSIAAIAPFVALARTARLERGATALALGLAATNPYLVLYAQELRMYSLLLLLSLASLWAFARLVDRERGGWADWALLPTANVALDYTPYFGWLGVAVEAAYVLVFAREILKRFAAHAAVVAACFAPWVYAVTIGAPGERGLDPSFRDRPTISDVVAFFGALSGPSTPLWLAGLAATVTLGLVAFVSARRETWRAERTLLLLAAVGIGPAAISFVASHLLEHSVWRERYLIISALPFMLAAAAAAFRLPSRFLRALAIVCLAAAALAGAVVGRPTDQRVDIAGIVEQVLAAEPEGVTIYAFGWRVYSPIRFYVEQSGASSVRVLRVPDAGAVEGEHFWVAYPESRLEKAADPRPELERLGYRLGETLETGEAGNRIFLIPVSRAKSTRGVGGASDTVHDGRADAVARDRLADDEVDTRGVAGSKEGEELARVRVG
jgi:uncharacterized membrane protein